MAKLIVNRESLVSVADAIREKGGTSESLEFPQGFVDVINAIESGGGTEEIENLIDESGVLDSTDGTATEKVEQLIDLAQWENVWFEQSAKWSTVKDLLYGSQIKKAPRLQFTKCATFTSFLQGSTVEEVDYLIESGFASINCPDMFSNTTQLKHIVGVKSKIGNALRMFNNSRIEVIDEPLDLSNVTVAGYMTNAFACAKLREVRFVKECLKLSVTFTSALLSNESIQSIIDGLAYVTTSQNLTLNSSIVVTDNQKQVIRDKGWTLIQ